MRLHRRGAPARGRARQAVSLERVMGIEPTSSAWEAEVLPLNYTRESGDYKRRLSAG